MSEPVTKQRPTIDLDDFERRLRQTNIRDDDPLAELARLVGEQPDPYGDVFARDAGSRSSFDDGRHEPRMHGAAAEGKPAFAPFAAIEAGLRGGNDPHGDRPLDADDRHHAFDGMTADRGFHSEAPYPETDYPGGDAHVASPAPGEWSGRSAYGDTADRGNRRPMYLMAATIAVGVIGIGTAFALKSHVGTSPREVKTIMAESGPTKIQPPADQGGGDRTSQDAALLGNGSQTAPTSLVNREEQPVDVSQAVRDNAARGAAAGGGSDAASIAVPASPGRMALAEAAGAPAAETQGFASDVTPKHVKVVSVRPDGTPIAEAAPDQPTAAPVVARATTPVAAPRQAPTKTSDRAGPVAKASTPKSTVRIAANTPKSIDALSADTGAEATAKPARKAKPQRVASAEPAATDSDAAPVASSGGGFAVQLAAPGSEGDAKAVSAKLGKKFAGVLGGRRLGFHEAQSNGHSVYRVRVSSLSREDAVSLCEKLKADGGSCFVAKN